MAELNESSASNFNGAGELVSKSQVDQKLMVSQLYQSQKYKNDGKHYQSYQKGQFPHQYEIRK
jgi:hypothetical protein